MSDLASLWKPPSVVNRKLKRDVAELYLAAGADPNVPKPNGDFPLLKAVEDGHVAAAKVLLAAGADPNVRNSRGLTPLWQAAAHNKLSLIRMLLAAGANPRFRWQQGTDPTQ